MCVVGEGAPCNESICFYSLQVLKQMCTDVFNSEKKKKKIFFKFANNESETEKRLCNMKMKSE